MQKSLDVLTQDFLKERSYTVVWYLPMQSPGCGVVVVGDDNDDDSGGANDDDDDNNGGANDDIADNDVKMLGWQ